MLTMVQVSHQEVVVFFSYAITFTQYGDADQASLYDIDLPAKAKKRTAAAMGAAEEAPASLDIPEYLKIKESDTPEQQESKRRRVRAMKKNHGQLVKEIDLYVICFLLGSTLPRSLNFDLIFPLFRVYFLAAVISAPIRGRVSPRLR